METGTLNQYINLNGMFNSILTYIGMYIICVSTVYNHVYTFQFILFVIVITKCYYVYIIYAFV